MSSGDQVKTETTNTQDVVTVDPVTDAKLRLRLFAGLLLGGVWLTGLAVLAWQTANPVTLNREQIRRSRWVVVGTLDTKTKLLKIEKEWQSNERFKKPGVSITNLDATRLRPGQRYIVPLQRDSRDTYSAPTGWEVTPTLLPNKEPLVYPATDDALAQLKRIQQELKEADQ